MNPPFLTIDGVSMRFGKIQALQNVALTLNPGERLVVLGPTGAGKTTLLRTIAGLEEPDAGRIHIEGHDITHWPPADRDVALVFQNFSLYPNKTVRENLAFPLRAPGRNLSHSEIAEQVDHAAEILRITPLLNRPANHLSGGEMQRVAIGRAIVRKPRLFLMDEPLTNLDAKLRESLRVEIIRLQRDLGTPMVYVTHDQIEALSMADRIAVLSEGQILQTGAPESVYRQPVSPRVARLLGYPPINLIGVYRKDGRWHTQNGAPVCPAPTDAPQRATLGLRPEDIAPTGGELPATVRVVEDMGPATILLVHWAGEDIHLLTTGSEVFRPGDTIYPAIGPNAPNIWPEDTP